MVTLMRGVGLGAAEAGGRIADLRKVRGKKISTPTMVHDRKTLTF